MRYMVENLQACEPDALSVRAGIVIEHRDELDSQGFPRVDVIGETPEAIASYVIENWGLEDLKWFREYVLDAIHADPSTVGWCHICNRDIAQAGDHAPGCFGADRGPDHPEIAPAKPYRCTILVEMPADDGKNIRPDEVVAWMQEQGIELVQWHDEDLIGGEER